MEPRAATPCRDLVAELVAGGPPSDRIELDLPGSRTRIRGDHPGVMAALRSYYRERLAAPGSGPVDLEILALRGPSPALPWELAVKIDDKGRPSKEAWIDLADGRIVRKIKTGVVVIMGRDGARAIDAIAGPIDAHVDQVINFVHHRAMARAIGEGGCLAHAAGIAAGGRGVVLCGTSGAGKSTLALHLMAEDPTLAFVSNDRLILGRGAAGPRMLGIPKHPRVNPGTILHNPALAPLLSPEARAGYAGLEGEALRSLEDKRDAVIDRLFGPGRFELAATSAAALFLRWRPGGGPAVFGEVALAERPELLPLIHKRLGLFFWPHPPPADAVAGAALIDALAGVPTFEVTGGIDFAAATAWVRGRLASA